MSKATEKAEMRAEAIKALKDMGVKPGVTLYTAVSHVAKSGASRVIRVYMVRKGEIVNISGFVAHALGRRRHENGGFYALGGGMAMDWETIYCVGRALFPGGDKKFVSGVREAQAKRMGETRETDGGYLLKQSSL